MTNYYNDISSSDIKSKIEECKNVILPLGAVEAHSSHLPLGTDNYLVEYYTDKLSEMTNSLLLPTLYFGQVWSLKNSPGSINIEEETLVNMLVDIITSLDNNEVKMVTLVSAHFGNISACKTAARRVYEKLKIKVVYITYPNIKQYLDIFEVVNNHSLFLHADEVETSMMLYIKPGLVDMSKAEAGTTILPPEVDYTPVRWTEFSDNFIIGDARKSTKEKGEILFSRVLKEASNIINYEKDKLK